MSGAQAALPPVQVVADEYELIADVVCGAAEESEAIALLWRELQRAAIVRPAEAPPDLVRMGSALLYSDLLAGSLHYGRVTYPEEAAAPGDVAVSSPLGAALIGLRAGSAFVWISGPGEVSAVRVEWVEPPPRRPGRRAGGH